MGTQDRSLLILSKIQFLLPKLEVFVYNWNSYEGILQFINSACTDNYKSQFLYLLSDFDSEWLLRLQLIYTAENVVSHAETRSFYLYI